MNIGVYSHGDEGDERYSGGLSLGCQGSSMHVKGK